MAYFGDSNGLKEVSNIEILNPDEIPAPPELDLLTLAEVRKQETGEVKTKGVVTAKLNNSIQIQDDTGAIAVRPTSLDVELGDEITVRGNLNTYNGLLQLQGATIEEDVKKSSVPEPIKLKGADLDAHQSELAVMENIEIVKAGGKNNTGKDETGTEFTIYDENDVLGLTEGTTYESITGIVSDFNGVQLIPRDAQDVIQDSSIVQPVFASPQSGNIPAGTEVVLSSSTDEAKIYYTTDGTNPTKSSTEYTGPITIDKDMTIQAIAVVEDRMSELAEFNYTAVDISEGNKIHEIQGSKHYSPMQGERVYNVKGVVTYVYDIKGAQYFHMQTPEGQDDGDKNTSEGLVVYLGTGSNYEVGDLVQVTGTVSEYQIDGYGSKEEDDLPITEINARDDKGGIVNVVESNVELPKAIKLSSTDLPDKIKEGTLDNFDPEAYALDYWETLEGMRVEVQPSKAVAPQDHGDLFVVTEDYNPSNVTANGGIRLMDDTPNTGLIPFKVQPNGPARDLKVKTGDKFTKALTGVVNYGFGNYKVYADLGDVEDALVQTEMPNTETTIKKDEDKLSVATYNVENFSANVGETSETKATKIAETFVKDMNEPDIIGIVEIMSNQGSDSKTAEASESYQRLIDKIVEAGGPIYEFANIDPEYNKDGGKPSGNIRVGFLYNPKRVSMIDKDKGGSTDAVGYENGELTLNPGRVSPTDFPGTRKPLAAEFEFKGDSVVVIANHLNSKRGDQGFFGQNQPPVMGSRDERKQLAQSVNTFVDEILADSPDENIVVLGDMNDFETSEPLRILEGGVLTNLVEEVPEERRYSYVYQGNSQVLDHILVSNNMADTADIDMINVNSDYTDMHGRASDHDPVLAQLVLGDTSAQEKTFAMSVMHMNDTHARVENYPYMVSAVKEFRGENPDALLVNAGDVFSGTLYFNEFEGQADLALMNLMGIDAMAFGNHEFDLGDSDNGHQALADFIDGANFPFLGTNADFSKDDKLKGFESKETLAEDPEDGKIYETIVKEINGEKVGIFGLTTEDTKNISSPNNVDFSDFITAAEEAVQAFEDAGINKVMAVNHLGFDSAPDIGNDMRLAAEVPGIDIIVGGHSHTALPKAQVVEKDNEGNDKAPTVIVQAGQYAENLGKLNIEFNDTGEIVEFEAMLEPLLPEEDRDTGEVTTPYVADEEALKVMQEYKDQVDKIANEETGAVAVTDLENPRHGEGDEMSVRANETRLGNLVTDAMLAKAQEKFPEAVIAFQNGGGIRTSIDQGPITTGEVISVLPFGNNPVIADLSGEEIKELLEHAVRKAPEENGGFLHISGMKYYYDSTKDAGDRVVKMYIDKDGDLEEIKLDKTYKVTTNGFTGQGGDGFETFAKAFADGRVRDIGEEDWQQLIDYMVEEEYLGGTVDPEIEGRITDLEGGNLPDDGTSDENYSLSVMHMNDTHARVENYPSMISAIDEFRGTNPDALLVNAGDVFSGTLYFNEFEGQADLALMNLMNIDAMVFGNHEFDLGDSDEGHQALADFIDGANFPFLGTNADFSKDDKLKGYESKETLAEDPEDGKIYETIVKEINGEKVGIFGLTTEDTKNISSPNNVDFSDFITAAEEAVQAFEDAGINKVMAVNHLGFDSAPDIGNDMRLAAEVPGIDIIVGGHSHTEIPKPQVVEKDEKGNDKAPTVIVQGGQYAENLGTLNVEFDADGEIVSHNGELLAMENYEDDEEALKVMQEYKDQVDKIANEETGAVAVTALENPRHGEGDEMSVRANETRLGNLVTDAMLAKAQEKFPEAVIAFQNGGGIRTSIDQGPITTGEVISVLPFGNNPVIAELSGAEIKELLEHAVRQAPEENGGFLHVSGMKYYYDSKKEAGNRVVKMYVDKDGELTEIKLDKMYQVTTNGFTGQGGDGFETFAKAFADGRVRDIGEEDWQQLIDYMVEDRYLGGTVDPEIEGRITDLMGEDLPDDDGNDGSNGNDGANGNDGSNGNDGADGNDGANGNDGSDGKPGEDGGNGTDGANGTDGKPREDKDGESLPSTATNTYMYLLLGAFSTAIGAALILFKKKFSN